MTTNLQKSSRSCLEARSRSNTASQPRGYLTVLAKPVSKCNLRCAFCYQSLNNADRMGVMPRSVMHKLTDRINEHSGSDVSLQWIGGETLLPGIGFFSEAEERVTSKTVDYAIQTNGTLFTNDWIEFFSKRSNYQLSISFEVFSHLQNGIRVGRGRFKDSYSILTEALSALNTAEIDYGILTVVEAETIQIDPAEWLDKVISHGIRRIGLQLSYDQVYSGDLTIVQRYLEWLDGLFTAQATHNQLVEDPRKRLLIRESFYLYNMITRPQRAVSCCHHTESPCTDYMVTVDQQGIAYAHCDSFMGVRSAEGTGYRSGSIMQNSFEELIASELAQTIREQLAAGRKKCEGCSYFNLCKGGCGFFKGRGGNRIDLGFGDDIDAYCAIKIGLFSFVIDAEKRRTVLSANTCFAN
ncbi:radical SAM/SPASM domain-containing protein [Algihabitans albus]|uniref:radical SAM/SPASM domain-containing protein n=1 Tax=Algihabitans albus TaxID=2164067 RepID=UPI0013C300AA|nr:radical SAM protein [Algihabitans albus]